MEQELEQLVRKDFEEITLPEMLEQFAPNCTIGQRKEFEEHCRKEFENSVLELREIIDEWNEKLDKAMWAGRPPLVLVS